MVSYQEIASNYNIKVYKIQPNDNYCINNGKEVYFNRSFCIGREEILIGIYNNKDEEAASFFHELGHCITTQLFECNIFKNLPNNSFNVELDAWMVGLIEAYKYGYLLPRSCFDFMINGIKSYDNYKRRIAINSNRY